MKMCAEMTISPWNLVFGGIDSAPQNAWRVSSEKEKKKDKKQKKKKKKKASASPVDRLRIHLITGLKKAHHGTCSSSGGTSTVTRPKVRW